MKKLKLTKVIASLLIAVSALALNPIGASAEWKRDSIGWWYSINDPSRYKQYAQGFDVIDGKTYLFGMDGYMKTGWTQLEGSRGNNGWYYLYDNGELARNTTIGGYYVNATGAWIPGASANMNNVSTVYSQNSNEQIVTFVDKKLEQVVRDTINKPTGTLYKSDVVKITELNAIHRDIVDINGIQYLTNLEKLYLGNNDVSDISPLKGMTKLQTLLLSRNELSDISSIKGLINIQCLDLGFNKIDDISTLKGLTNLKILNLDSTKVRDLSAVKGLINLQKISLNFDQMDDISVLKELTGLNELSFNNKKYIFTTSAERISTISSISNSNSNTTKSTKRKSIAGVKESVEEYLNK